MIPHIKRPPERERKRLLEIFAKLGTRDRESVTAFAEFLLAKAHDSAVGDDVDVSLPEPKHLARPAKESVVAAMRRLSETYFMLEKSVVLHEASALMGAHVMQGRPAHEVIDELETLFRNAYDRHSRKQRE